MTTETDQTPLYTLALRLCDRAVERAALSGFPDTGWAVRHRDAFRRPTTVGRESRHVAGTSVAFLIRAWLLYGDAHRAVYDSRIGDDYVLGDEWATIGVALRGLLNGELGELDGGTTDSIILGALGAEGFDENGERKNVDDAEPESEPESDRLDGSCLCHDAAVCPDNDR